MEKKKTNISFIFAIVEGIFLFIILLGISGFFILKEREQNKFLGVWEHIQKEDNTNEESTAKTKIQLKIEKKQKVSIYIASYNGENWIYGEEREGKYHIKDNWLSIELHDEEEDVDYIWLNFLIKDNTICYSYDCEDQFDKTNLKELEKENIVEEEKEDASFDLTNLKEIKGTDIQAKSMEETMVVLIARETCSWCLKFGPVYENVTKEYGVTPYYIDITKILDFSKTSFSLLDEESYQTIVSLSGEGVWETFAADNFGATPQVLIIKNNQVIGGCSGYTDETSFKQVLEDAGIKK